MVSLQGIETTIEFVLRNADRIKKCVDEKRVDASAGKGSPNSGYQKNRISDPTAAQALQRIDIAGSLYLVGEVKASLGVLKDDQFRRRTEEVPSEH